MLQDRIITGFLLETFRNDGEHIGKRVLGIRNQMLRKDGMGVPTGASDTLNSKTDFSIGGFELTGIRTIVDHRAGLITVGTGQAVDREVSNHPVVGILGNKVVRTESIGYHKQDVVQGNG